MSWNKIIGQQRAKEMLGRAVRERRLAHAYLFWGPQGIGKDALAITLAQVLLCQKGTEEACGDCQSCRKVQSLQHPNLRFIVAMPAKKTDGKNDEEDLDETARIEMAKQTQEKAANPYFHISIPRAVAITIDRIRQIRHESSMSAYEPGRKVFIISDADMLNEAAANALLKILEEPHPDTIFLLTTSKKEKLLPTIVSRCQAIRCEMLSEEEIAEALQKREAVPEERARFFARLAHGNYSRALELLFNDLLGEREAALQLLKAIISGSLLSIDECNDTHDVFSDRQAAERHLDLLRLWLRDLLLLREGHADGIINIDQLKILQQILVPSAHSDIVSGMKTIERALELLRRNVYLPLVLMYLTIHLRKALLYGQE